MHFHCARRPINHSARRLPLRLPFFLCITGFSSCDPYKNNVSISDHLVFFHGVAPTDGQVSTSIPRMHAVDIVIELASAFSMVPTRSRPARDTRAHRLHAQERPPLNGGPIPDICEIITRSNHSLMRLPNMSLGYHVLGWSVGCRSFSHRRVSPPLDASPASSTRF